VRDPDRGGKKKSVTLVKPYVPTIRQDALATKHEYEGTQVPASYREIRRGKGIPPREAKSGLIEGTRGAVVE